MNPFLDLYKDYSNSELLKITERPNDYQPMAVEAAKAILQSRNLSGNEMLDALEQIEDTAVKKSKAEVLIDQSVDTYQSSGRKLVQELKAMFSSIDRESADYKTVRIILVATGLLFLPKVAEVIGFLPYLYEYWSGPIIETALTGLLNVFFIITTLVFLWYRKKVGWIMLALLLLSYGITPIYDIIQNHYEESVSTFLPKRYYGLNLIVIKSLSILFLYAVLLYFICKQRVRAVFKVSNISMVITLALMLTLQGFMLNDHLERIKQTYANTDRANL